MKKLLTSSAVAPRLLAAVLLVGYGFAAPVQAAMTYEVLPVPSLRAVGSMPGAACELSPDGRWVAYFMAGKAKRERILFYDLVNKRRWIMDGGRLDAESYGGGVLAWRQDSRACAVGAARGWVVAWPGSRRILRLTRTEPAGECCAAWSPRTGKLALFEGAWGNSLYRVWNGRRLTKGIVWYKTVGFPYNEERAWQCAWSPDEKQILLRFYGHAERSSYQGGHTVALNPRTARFSGPWGAEAGPARWIEGSRLVFNADDHGMGLEPEISVAKPATGQSNVWLKKVAAWTVTGGSHGHNTLWALRGTGDLCRTPARKRQWRVVRRGGAGAKAMPWSSLLVSPRGDMAAFCAETEAHNLSLVSTSPRRPWALSWRAPTGTIKLLGWARGQTLPLLVWERGEQAVLVQLKKS